MPEHRTTTPDDLRDLESFLWWDFDRAELWTQWMQARGFPLDASSYAEAVEVQRHLRALEAANNGGRVDPATFAALDQFVAAHELRPRFGSAGELDPAAPRAGDPIGRVLALAVRSMLQGRWARFKLCREPTCRASYFDASKNASKTWCSMDSCGARHKMRRYRARQSGSGARQKES